MCCGPRGLRGARAAPFTSWMTDPAGERLDDTQMRAVLHELFACVGGMEEYLVLHDDDGPTSWEPYRFVGIDDDAGLLFRGRSLELLQTLEVAYAEHAATGGWSAESVSEIVIQACKEARVQGPDAGVAVFRRAVRVPPRVWTVFLPAVDVIDFESGEELRIGRASLTMSRTREDGHPIAALEMDSRVGGEFRPPVWRVRVAARDKASAHFLAWEHVQDARAVMSLSESIDRQRPKAILLPDGPPESGRTVGMAAHVVRFYGHNMTDRAGELVPDFRALSFAAGLLEPERNDWQRRTIAATRWYLEAATTWWYAESLAAAMTALECLLVAGRREQNKRETIAERVTSIAVLRSLGVEQQKDWLAALYARRNDTVHEGLSVAEDLDVTRLVDLTHAVCRWAARHLVPMHRSDEMACTSFSDVWDRTLHADRGP